MGLAPTLRCPDQFLMTRGISARDRFSELSARRGWTRTQKLEGLMEPSQHESLFSRTPLFDLRSRVHS